MNKIFNLSAIPLAATATLATVALASAPAQAVGLAGQLNWSGLTSDFYSDVNPSEDDSFTVTFDSSTSVLFGTGPFDATFPTIPDNYSLIPSPTATFNWVSSTGDSFVYELADDLVFNFDADKSGDFDPNVDVSVTYGAGEQFTGVFFGNAVAITEASAVDASVTIAGVDIPVLAEDLALIDTIGAGPGTYAAQVETVPEPLTMLGTGLALGLGGLFKSQSSKKQSAEV